MIRNIIFLCTLLCAAFADSCFDYDALKSTLSAAVEECKPTADPKSKHCVDEYHTCITNKFGFLENNAFIHNKTVEFVSEFATDKVKETIGRDTAMCKMFEKRQILDAAYLLCFGIHYVPKCPEVLLKAVGFWFMVDGTIFKTCGSLG